MHKGMLLSTFYKLVACPFLYICSRFSVVTIGQLEILSYNIVFHKPIAQCSNQFTTDGVSDFTGVPCYTIP